MLREIVFLIVSFIVCWRGVQPFLDIDELKNIHYDIDIIDQPVLFGRPVQEEVIYMKSKYGQRYECKLPDITDLEMNTEEEKTASEIGVSDLLKPMESAPCLRKTKDWWSYDFCYGRKIEQFHLDSDNIIGDKVVLGVYDSETDWRDNATTDSKKNRFNRYHSHNYVNGSMCDINGQPRQAEVRFHCAEGEGDSIARIDEPSTCTYILTIHTTRICHHPYLKLPPKVKPKSVLCSPALNQDQFETYRHFEEQAKEAAKQLAQEKMEKEEEKTVSFLQSVLSSKKEDDDVEGTADDSENDPLSPVDEELAQNKAELKKLLDKYSVSVSDIDMILAMGVDPHVLASALEKVMTSVQGSLDSINKEIGEDRETDEDEDDYDDEDELDKQDFRSLLSEFRSQIADVEENEARRLQALVDELEATFNFVEAMDESISEEPEGATDDDGEVEGEKDDLNKDGDEDDYVEDNEKPDVGEDGDTSEGETVKIGEEEAEAEDEDDDIDLNAQEEKLMKRINNMIKELMADPEKGTDDTKKLSPQEDEEGSDDRVKVRITRINMNKEKGKDPSQEVKLYDTDHNRLEEAIQDHLEQSGIQVEGGGRIELKVLTYSADDWPGQEGEDEGVAILSEEETTYFKNIVSGLLGSQGRLEEEHHDRLQSGYQFHWNAEGHRMPSDREDPDREDPERQDPEREDEEGPKQ